MVKNMTRPQRQFVSWKFGQLHIRVWPSDHPIYTPLICLPPSPYSSVAYEALAPLLAGNRTVVALDYPGYGASDPVKKGPSIATYAEATLAVANSLFAGQKLCLLGFHTGTLVAAETSRQAPQAVDSLVLIDVPYFEKKRRNELLQKMGKPKPISPDLSMLAEAWEFGVTNRLGVLDINRSYDLFVDQISSGEREPEAFRAAFNYPCTDRFPEIECPATCIATKAGLYEQTLSAARAIRGCGLIELPQINVAVLELGAQSIADTVQSLSNAELH